MIVKIRQYQQGGGLMASIYQPVINTPGASGYSTAQTAINLLNGSTGGAGSSSSSDKGSITEKDLYTGLYKTIAEQGLLNDAQYIIKQLQTDLFNDQLLDPFGDSSNLSNQYLKALSYVSMAKSNQKLYDDAYKQATSNGSLQEAAVTSNGGVVVKKDGKLEIITPEQYKKDPNSYTLMTNGNLLAERMNNPEQAFKNDLLAIVQGGTSTKEIMQTIDLFIKDLGSNEDTIQGYSRNDLRQIQGGISLLQTAAAKYGGEQVADMIKEGGLYKIGITSEEQIKQAQMAITAILEMLPEQQRTLLKLKSDGTDRGLLATISLLVNKNTTNKFSFTPELQKENTSSSSSSSSGEEDFGKIKLGPEEQYYLGLGNKQDITFQNGTQYAFTAHNAVSRSLTDQNGKATGVSTADALAKSTYNNQFYLNQATLGGQRISSEALHNIVIDGNIVSATLPIDVEAKNNQNIIKPDFEHLKKLEEADKQVRDAGIDTSIIAQAQAKIQNGQQLSSQETQLLQSTIQKINQIYKNNGLSQIYDSMGNLTAQYHRFTLVNAKAPEGVFAQGTDWKSTGLQEITDDAQIDNILDIINKDRGEKHQYNFEKKGWFGMDNVWLFDYDKMFEGVLFIPMKESFIDAYTNNLSPEQANAIDAREQFNIRLQGGFKE